MRLYPRVFLLVGIALLLLTTPSVAQPIDTPILLSPFIQPDGSTVTVSSDQEIMFVSGWAACTPGLVRSFIQAIHLEWTINDQPTPPFAEANRYWEKISKMESAPGFHCEAGNGSVWQSLWLYPVGTLEPGSYQVHSRAWLAHPVLDGSDSDGDGKKDKYSGELIDWSITVQVSSAP
jgi:hypothetical protein